MKPGVYNSLFTRGVVIVMLVDISMIELRILAAN
jgi:hypothetical protein